jgi:hypothetical protein
MGAGIATCSRSSCRDFAELDLGFDLEVIGFETAEIDLLVGGNAAGETPDPADEIATIDPEARCKHGGERS